MSWGVRLSGRALRVHVLIVAAVLSSGTTLAQPLGDATPFSIPAGTLYTQASAATAPEGADVYVLDASERYQIAADGTSRYTQHFIYKVLTPEGAETWNSLDINWSAWRADKPTLKARVVTADGKEYLLDPATIADSAAYAQDTLIYSDERVLRAPLPAIAPGVVVETLITMSERPMFAGAGTVARTYFQMGQPVRRLRLEIEAAKSVPLRYRMDLLQGMTPKHTEQADTQRWVFESTSIPAAEEQVPGLPRDVYAYPMVTFSTAESWQALALEYSKIVASKLEGTDVSALVARVTKGRDSRTGKAAAIVEYLNREIRYTGIEFGLSSIVPHAPNETLARKYGDCKDKSLLLIAMLRAAGVRAHLALLNVSDRLDVPSELPGMGLFDHAIVYVPGEPDWWIDATDETARLGQIPDGDQGRWALIIDAATTDLKQVHEARSIDNRIFEEREIRLADQGPARAVEISKPSGSFESEYRRAYAHISDKETKESLTDYMKSEYVAEHLEKLDSSDPKDFSRPFELNLEASRARRGYTGLSDAVAYIRIEGLFNQLPGDLQTREPTPEENAKATRPQKPRMADYELTRPFVAEWHYKVVPPRGFEPVELPPDQEHPLGPASYREKFSKDADGVVHAHLRFDTVKRRFTAAEQSALRNSVARLLEREAIAIKFHLKAYALMNEGRPRESFDAYRQLVADQPKDAIQRLRRATALLEAGFGEAARNEARQAVKLDSKSAFAHETLAHILQHDLLGRWRAPGADFAGAAAALRTAIALDPQDKTLVADYAILLEHNAQGTRYGVGADLKAAIEQYRALTLEQLEDMNVANNLPFALFYAGELQQAREIAAGLNTPPAALIVACDALIRGVPQALDEARRRSNGDAQFKETVMGAGRLLMFTRHYPPAATLFEAGAAGANAARTMGLASTLRSARRHEELQLADTPEDLVRRFMIAMIRGVSSFDALSPFESRSARLDRLSLSSAEAEETIRKLRSFLADASRSGMTPDVLADLWLQAIQFKKAGDDSVGYRVSLQMPAMDNEHFFVVKEGRQYKLLDSSDRPVALALEVLDRLEREDLAGASALLRLLRETLTATATDDPYQGALFLRFWSAGRQDADASTIALSAAALLVQERRSAKRGIEILERAKASAATQDAHLESIELALLTGYQSLRAHEQALQVAASLARRQPTSDRVFFAQLLHMHALKRFAEARALATQRLQAHPQDLSALRALAETSAAQLDFAGAYEQGLQVVAHSNSTGRDLNQLAWYSLFFERSDGPDIDSAMRAAQLQPNAPHILYTLACVYAENGKTREAREVLLQYMELSDLEEPSPEFRYTLGRIAEQLGEREIALASYAQVTPPRDPALDYYSSHRLARLRAARLQSR